MPSQVRIISKRNSRQWDELVQDIITRGAFGQEHDYFGITDPERADSVRRAIRTAGKHLGVGSKVFWHECTGCENGGPECKFHVSYTVYSMEEARKYKAGQAESAQKRRR